MRPTATAAAPAARIPAAADMDMLPRRPTPAHGPPSAPCMSAAFTFMTNSFSSADFLSGSPQPLLPVVELRRRPLVNDAPGEFE
mmetsp:Transcript_83/g.193  ORF Transcript_83/g.193 Transcript_83/m.193 type:complete len:84 (+) Transcript_83:777-1028(+)